eukprot:TRINITY_DN4101_c0_g1_i11.p1 TRINITY_DN4101_c0_g1~~TRINITY_DN4101_c0_g1_i11.p1  ORF type:complete len:138 (+),score=5.53 TRINITY_DN4101_c0_g1_i11:224-637(+)
MWGDLPHTWCRVRFNSMQITRFDMGRPPQMIITWVPSPESNSKNAIQVRGCKNNPRKQAHCPLSKQMAVCLKPSVTYILFLGLILFWGFITPARVCKSIFCFWGVISPATVYNQFVFVSWVVLGFFSNEFTCNLPAP